MSTPLSVSLDPRLFSFAERVVEQAGVLDPDVAVRVGKALASVPRSAFVEPALQARAYEDHALPIGFGQTISKPSTVARMLGLIEIAPRMNILEVGCGSGYCSAVMQAAGAHVYAIEYVGLLAQRTRKALDAMGYYRILVKRGDGKKGWTEHAPFDAIVISTSFEEVPEGLLDQLAVGGKLVAPIGNSEEQIMTLVERTRSGFQRYALERCLFVEGQ